MKTKLFENAPLTEGIWKRWLFVFVWKRSENGAFRKRWRHDIIYRVISLCSKQGQISRKFPRKVSRKSGNCWISKKQTIQPKESQIERKFPVRNFWKFPNISQGCPLFQKFREMSNGKRPSVKRFPRRSVDRGNYDGHWNATKQKTSCAEQWLCSCVLNLRFSFTPNQQWREMKKFRVV